MLQACKHDCKIKIGQILNNLLMAGQRMIKKVLSRASPYFEQHVKPLILAAFAVVSAALNLFFFLFYFFSAKEYCVPAVGTLMDLL
jgi:hypothetical protein